MFSDSAQKLSPIMTILKITIIVTHFTINIAPMNGFMDTAHTLLSL